MAAAAAQQQHHRHGDGAAHPQGGPVVAAQVGVEPDRGRRRGDQGGQHREGAVGDQHPGQDAGERQPAQAGLAGADDGLDPVSGLQAADPGSWPLRKRAQNGRGSPHRSAVR